MKPKLEKIKRYIDEEIKPYCPVIVGKICIKDISPKRILKSNPVKEYLKPVKINRYQSVNKMQEVFYKTAYRIKTTKHISKPKND